MVSATDLNRLRQAQDRVVELATNDLTQHWRSLDLSRPESVRDDLLVFVPAVTTTYGEMGAAASADWYDQVRADSPARGRFRARMAPAVPVAGVQDRVRYGARHLFTETPNQMLGFLTVAVSGYALQPMRDTVAQSADADPGAFGWRRRASADACTFCAYMAVVLDQASYEQSAAKYHGDCRCVPVMAFHGDTIPDQPNEDEWRGVFDDARQQILDERQRVMREWRAAGGRQSNFFRAHPHLSLSNENIMARARRIGGPGLFRDGIRLAA